ncbi:LysM peptidoglycan-binding domain-containing protein [Pseudonocardia acaciae]|uniref:LysM peptidoglycan-binding domain-containing protein n=1 Tax=Pseudonocardia acaciae TaxID=551276 RepID=UPI0006884C58|nr:LysM domain-containing protein [Pseudonocardia acaciae]
MSHRTLILLVTSDIQSELRARFVRNRTLVGVAGLVALVTVAALLALFTNLALQANTPTPQPTPSAITATTTTAPPPAARRPASPPPEQRPTDRTYQVRPGDTLASIALRHGVDYRRIAEDNRLTDPNLIRPAQSLRIGHPTPGVQLIQPGATLTTLATATGLTVRDLLTLNPWITDPDRIPAGAGLRVRA